MEESLKGYRWRIAVLARRVRAQMEEERKKEPPKPPKPPKFHSIVLGRGKKKREIVFLDERPKSKRATLQAPVQTSPPPGLGAKIRSRRGSARGGITVWELLQRNHSRSLMKAEKPKRHKKPRARES